MQNDFLNQKILNILPGTRKRSSNGSININCPMCILRGQSRPDTKHRCGIRPDSNGSISINCFNCAFKSKWSPGSLLSKNIKEFLSALGVNDLEIKKLNFHAWQLSHNSEAPVRESSIFIPNFQELALPTEAKTLTEWANLNCTNKDFYDVISYAASRGDAIFNNSTFYWSPDKTNNMNRRLIVPFYWKDKIVGYTGRAIDDKIKPKYMTNTPGHFLFNNHNMYKNRKYIILVEGQFDAIAIDGVATQGAKLSEQQAYWLNDSGKTIIVLPDRDKAGQNLIDLALTHDWQISFPEWEADIKDANDAIKKYGRLYTVKSIIDSATNNKLKINLLRKKWKCNEK